AGAELAVAQQARGHEGEEAEPEEGEPRREGQRVPPRRVLAAPAEEQPCEDADRHGEVEGAVEDVPELDEHGPPEEELLDRLLVEQTEGLLDVDDEEGVLVGDEALDRRRAELVADPRVEAVEGGDVEHLPPPA